MGSAGFRPFVRANMMTSSNENIFHITDPLWEEFTGHRRVTRSFDVFFDLRLNKRLSKQSRRRWFHTPSRSLWRHCNEQENINAPQSTIRNRPTGGPPSQTASNAESVSMPRRYHIIFLMCSMYGAIIPSSGCVSVTITWHDPSASSQILVLLSHNPYKWYSPRQNNPTSISECTAII